MRWITREHPRVDRVACPWLIQRFIDAAAEFVYVAADAVLAEAKARDATAFDVPGVHLGRKGSECSFDAFVHTYRLADDPALIHLARIVRAADTGRPDLAPEALGFEAILEGVRVIHFPNDQEQRAASVPIMEALYAYCRERAATSP